jgi:hypothetical protein
VKVVSISYDAASITSFVSKWRPFNFIFNWGTREIWGGKGTKIMLFLVKNSIVKKDV